MTMMTYRQIPASELRPGMRLRYLGALRTVAAAYPAPWGKGYVATFTDGPQAEFPRSVSILVEI